MGLQLYGSGVRIDASSSMKVSGFEEQRFDSIDLMAREEAYGDHESLEFGYDTSLNNSTIRSFGVSKASVRSSLTRSMRCVRTLSSPAIRILWCLVESCRSRGDDRV